MTPADPPPDYLLRVRSLDGALRKAQSLALRELGPLAEGVTGDLGRALQRLATALKEGSPSQIGSAVLACKTRMRGEMLVRFQKVEAVIATHYRWCYSAHNRPGRRPFELKRIEERFAPEGFPVWVELMHDGAPISGPIFVEPTHADAQDVADPISPTEYLRKYNTWKKAQQRARRGIVPKEGRSGRSYRTVCAELEQVIGSVREKVDAAMLASPVVAKLLQTQQLSADLDQLLDLAGELHELAYRKSS